MKISGQCPKCACPKLYVVEEVRQADHDSFNLILPVTVTCAAVPSSDVGGKDGNTYRAAIGRFEAWVCSSCGLTEWYAKDFAAAFEKLARLGRDTHVRIAERPQQTPYR